MESKEKYRNLASSDHPATIIYLVDISGSMKAPMLDGKIRINVAKDAIQNAYAQMIQRSLRQGKIHPRYRVGMIAYSTDLFDVYGDLGSIVTIDKLKDEGVPLITPQHGTDMAKAFRYANKLIQNDIKTWSQKWLDECPSPIVINLTDCEFGEEIQDPVEFAKQLQEISVPDGNVLVENIFITDQITLPSANIKDWKGYRFNESTGDPYGDILLTMSSPLPPSYAQLMSEQTGLKIREGTAMMFPGISREFIKTGFAMSTVTGGQIKQPLRPRYPGDEGNSPDGDTILEVKQIIESERKAREQEEIAHREKATEEEYHASKKEIGDLELAKKEQERVLILLDVIDKMVVAGRFLEAKRILENLMGTDNLIMHQMAGTFGARWEMISKIINESLVKDNEWFIVKLLAEYHRFKVSIAHPKLLSKNLESPFVVQLSIQEMESAVKAKIKAIIGNNVDEHVYDTKLKLGQIVKIKLFSPDITFPEPKVKKLALSTNITTFLAKPTDNCSPREHDVELSIIDNDTNIELQTEMFKVNVKDFAFDHVSRPLLSKASAVVLGIGSIAVFILTFLEQIDKTVGLTSGTAAGVFALGIYASFFNLYQRVRPNTP